MLLTKQELQNPRNGVRFWYISQFAIASLHEPTEFESIAFAFCACIRENSETVACGRTEELGRLLLYLVLGRSISVPLFFLLRFACSMDRAPKGNFVQTQETFWTSIAKINILLPFSISMFPAQRINGKDLKIALIREMPRDTDPHGQHTYPGSQFPPLFN